MIELLIITALVVWSAIFVLRKSFQKQHIRYFLNLLNFVVLRVGIKSSNVVATCNGRRLWRWLWMREQ
jgi:hypothetical protein